jgi:hypothetical protein
MWLFFLFFQVDAGTDSECCGDMLGNEMLNSASSIGSAASQPSGSLAVNPLPARTLSSVLKRLSHIVAGRAQVGFLLRSFRMLTILSSHMN